jgi:hypothetical protein
LLKFLISPEMKKLLSKEEAVNLFQLSSEKTLYPRLIYQALKQKQPQRISLLLLENLENDPEHNKARTRTKILGYAGTGLELLFFCGVVRITVSCANW